MGLITAHALHARLRWDPALPTRGVIIGVADRFQGVRELAFEAFVPDGDVPWHRLRYLRVGPLRFWDRAERIDLLEGSGRVPARFEEVAAALRAAAGPALPQAAACQRRSLSWWGWEADAWRVVGPAPSSGSAGRPLSAPPPARVWFWNVLFDRHLKGQLDTPARRARLLSLLLDRAPALFCLAEVTPEHAAQLAAHPALRARYWLSSRADDAELSPYGLLLGRRRDPGAAPGPVELLQFEGHKRALLWRGLQRHWAFVHLPSQRARDGATARAAQLRAVGEALSSPGVLVGDHNRLGETELAFLAQRGLVEVLPEGGPADTFRPAQNPLAALSGGAPGRLDRVFTVEGSGLRLAHLDGAAVSDHDGLEITLPVRAAGVGLRPSHASALVLLPPAGLVQSRQSRWPAHLTLLHPFVVARDLGPALHRIRAALAGQARCAVRLPELTIFRNAASASLVVRAEGPASLLERLGALFPECPQRAERSPHITIEKKKRPASGWQRSRSRWRPAAFTADRLVVLQQGADGVFRESAALTLPLAGEAPWRAVWRRIEACAAALGIRVQLVGSARLGLTEPGDLDVVVERGRSGELDDALGLGGRQRPGGRVGTLEGVAVDLLDGDSGEAALAAWIEERVESAPGGRARCARLARWWRSWGQARGLRDQALGQLPSIAWTVLLARALEVRRAPTEPGAETPAAEFAALLSWLGEAEPLGGALGSGRPRLPSPTPPSVDLCRNSLRSTGAQLEAERRRALDLLAQGALEQVFAPRAVTGPRLVVEVRGDADTLGAARGALLGWLIEWERAFGLLRPGIWRARGDRARVAIGLPAGADPRPYLARTRTSWPASWSIAFKRS